MRLAQPFDLNRESWTVAQASVQRRWAAAGGILDWLSGNCDWHLGCFQGPAAVGHGCRWLEGALACQLSQHSFAVSLSCRSCITEHISQAAHAAAHDSSATLALSSWRSGCTRALASQAFFGNLTSQRSSAQQDPFDVCNSPAGHATMTSAAAHNSFCLCEQLHLSSLLAQAEAVAHNADACSSSACCAECLIKRFPPGGICACSQAHWRCCQLRGRGRDSLHWCVSTGGGAGCRLSHLCLLLCRPLQAGQPHWA